MFYLIVDQSAPPNKVAPSDLKNTQQFNLIMQTNNNTSQINNNSSTNSNYNANHRSLEAFQINTNNNNNSSIQSFDNSNQVIYTTTSFSHENVPVLNNSNLLNLNLQQQQPNSFQRNPSLVGSGTGDGADSKAVEISLKEEVVSSSNNEISSVTISGEFKTEIKTECDAYKQEVVRAFFDVY
jgi:hypothetical protein